MESRAPGRDAVRAPAAVRSEAIGRKPLSTIVDLVRSIFAAWERGDHSSAERVDPEIEWVFDEGPGTG